LARCVRPLSAARLRTLRPFKSSRNRARGFLLPLPTIPLANSSVLNSATGTALMLGGRPIAGGRGSPPLTALR
jgi:hypothetical protein